jgi:methylmalonyl-CoA mutase N-terminal domain/subunit
VRPEQVTTGGEVSHALRDVWGLYVPRETF